MNEYIARWYNKQRRNHTIYTHILHGTRLWLNRWVTKSALFYGHHKSHLYNNNAYDTGGLSSFIQLYNLRLFDFAEHTSDCELHIYLIYKWFMCFMLLVSSHQKRYFDASNELLHAHNFFIDSQCKDGQPGSCGEFERCKKWYTPALSIVNLELRRSQIALFTQFTSCECCIIVTTLVCGGAKIVQVNQNVICECFHCAFHIFWNFW